MDQIDSQNHKNRPRSHFLRHLRLCDFLDLCGLRRIQLPTGARSAADQKSGTNSVTYLTRQIIKDDQRLRDSPYPQYRAYIWSTSGGNIIDGECDTETYYMPKNRKQFYIYCMGEGGPDVLCSILFVYDSLLYVDVGINPENIPKAEKIVQQVSAFLRSVTEISKSPNFFDF